MSLQTVIDAFCVRHRNEDAHTRQVTRFALRFFDRLSADLGLDVRDRQILEAASRLHDVGFASAPGNHVEAGAALVLGEGLPGFSRRRLERVVAVMLLHSGEYGPMMAHPTVVAVADRERTLRLAAILRVADALDRGHVQHARLTTLRRTAGGLSAGVASPGYPGILPHIVRKTDLWNVVMPMPLRVRLVPSDPDPGPASVDALLIDDVSVEEAARKILLLQYRIIRENHAGAVAGESPEPLHDMRVALRRFRSALRLFRKPLDATSARALSVRCREFNRELGQVRDAHVWLAAMESPRLRERVAAGEAWDAYRMLQREEAARQQEVLRVLLASNVYRDLMRDMAYLLRTELPERLRLAEALPAKSFMARRLAGAFERIMGLSYLKAEGRPEQMHELRKLCRQERYWSEFAAPFIGRMSGRISLRLKAVADALGSMHDAHVALDRLAQEAPAPGGLSEVFLAEEAHARRAFEKAWARLGDRGFTKRASARLLKASRR